MPRQYTSPLRAKQAKQTRRAIIEAAIQLFLENGYAETSIRSIAEEAGVAERTVYVQFSDKTSILTAIGYHVFYGEESEDHDSQTEFKNSLAAIPDANERLRIAIHQLALGLEQGLAALARMVSFAAYGDPRLRDWIAEMVEVRHQAIRSEAEAVIGYELPNDAAHDQMIDELEAIMIEDLYWLLTTERPMAPRKIREICDRPMPIHHAPLWHRTGLTATFTPSGSTWNLGGTRPSDCRRGARNPDDVGLCEFPQCRSVSPGATKPKVPANVVTNPEDSVVTGLEGTPYNSRAPTAMVSEKGLEPPRAKRALGPQPSLPVNI